MILPRGDSFAGGADGGQESREEQRGESRKKRPNGTGGRAIDRKEKTEKGHEEGRSGTEREARPKEKIRHEAAKSA